jgi:hypothetical protein
MGLRSLRRLPLRRVPWLPLRRLRLGRLRWLRWLLRVVGTLPLVLSQRVLLN